MARRRTAVDHRRAILAAISRREWLLEMLALAAAGCAGHGAPSVEPMLTVAYSAGEEDVLFTDTSAERLVFLPLVTRNARGEIESRLARSWDHAPDYRTWTIRLRTGVTWHDGRPVTAHDIKFTLDLFMHPNVLLVAPGALSVTVLDDSTYTITYHTRVDAGGVLRASPLDANTVYYPKHLLEDLDPKAFRTWAFWSHPVGNGPYRVVRHVPQTMTEFEANADYYRGKPKIERVVLKPVPEGPSTLTELLSGNVQAAWVGSQALPKIRSDPRFLAYYYVVPNVLGTIAWNHRHLCFRDTAVRLALTLAINRRELYQVVDLPEETPILDMPTPNYVQGTEFPDSLRYDPARAEQLLDGAGWRDANGDGIRERGGQPFRFVALAQFRENQGAGDRIGAAAVYVQSELRRVGIEMQIQLMSRNVIEQRIAAGQFEAALAFVNYNPRRLLSWFGPGSVLGYTDARVTTLLSRAEKTMDADEISRIRRELMLIFQADAPVTFLFPNVEPTVASRRVRGLSSPYRADPVAYIEDLWLDDVKP